MRNIIDTEKVTIDGKEKSVTTLIPIATAVARLKSGGSTTGGGTGTGESTNTGSGDDEPIPGGDTTGGDEPIPGGGA